MFFPLTLARRLICVSALAACLIPSLSWADCREGGTKPECLQLEPLTIFGTADTARDVAGGASVITPEELQEFKTTDVIRALRRVPGVSVQLEDGWGLRPNISIRGTASERSSRITLMEDGVLIAPAPYAAPAAYYFPTFGRIHAVEVLKGPASITEGPYTVGGAINLLSTPIPAERTGYVQGEYGSDDTWRLHGWYGDTGERAALLVETHLWESDGYQHIDRSDNRTGLQKQDYLAKLAFWSDPSSAIYQSLEIKLQASEEDSQQSYLGLTDVDFDAEPLRRYGLSAEDEMHNEHEQIMLRWRLENGAGNGLTITAYDNQFERAWYKTEGVDVDGSADPGSFSRTSWASVVEAINRGNMLRGLDADALQAILDGADTPVGSIQLRNNAREYYSRGVQALGDVSLQSGSVTHDLQIGLRYHEDEEDRLQRNDNFHQADGTLVLDARGMEGNAGNRVVDASAWAAFVHDRIGFGRWVLTPGLRYENIELDRVDYGNSTDPGARGDANVRSRRGNDVDIWLPGLGAMYELNESMRLVGGVHRGFAAPSSSPGVDPEESINYELGFRYGSDRLSVEAMYFFNDYENLVGLCTNSSGADCTPGDAFNGEGVHIPGLELSVHALLEAGSGWDVPLDLAYTWMDAEFQTAFDSEFFGDVEAGDPVPYIMDHQVWASIGLQGGPWSFALTGNYLDSVCTRASCGPFEKTESATIFDLSAHYRIGAHWTLYAVVENLTDELHLAAREPYGARPGKARTVLAGARFSF